MCGMCVDICTELFVAHIHQDHIVRCLQGVEVQVQVKVQPCSEGGEEEQGGKKLERRTAAVSATVGVCIMGLVCSHAESAGFSKHNMFA